MNLMLHAHLANAGSEKSVPVKPIFYTTAQELLLCRRLTSAEPA
jgi:hypothetical protein